VHFSKNSVLEKFRVKRFAVVEEEVLNSIQMSISIQYQHLPNYVIELHYPEAVFFVLVHVSMQ